MNQLYFTINLNKFGEVRKQIETENKSFINTVVLFIICALALSGFIGYVNNSLQKKVSSRKKYLKSIENELKNYEAKGEYLSSGDLKKLAKLSSDRIFWSKKLVALPEVTSKKIAITDFSFKRGILSLNGITKVNKDEKEITLIKTFIDDIKNNEEFKRDFPEIRYVKSRKDKEKGVDIYRFQIDCVSNEKVGRK